MPYQNPQLSLDERITDLIGRMTLPEKVGQMLQLDARENITGLINDFQVF